MLPDHTITETGSIDSSTLTACCAAVYESDWARLLLGDSFHPGGLALTERLGVMLALSPSDTVLDIAAGNGTSAIYLAQRFGCRVVGLEYGADAVARARGAATEAGLQGQVEFRQGDAENLPFDSDSFDAAICECAFCTFTDKTQAAMEFARVLVPGGRLGLSDLTREGQLPAELDSLLAWIACIADARPAATYVAYLEAAAFAVRAVEVHDDALAQTVAEARKRLLGAQLLLGIKQIELPGVDFSEAQRIARSAAEAVRQGRLGYAVITAVREER